ncbi:MAG: VWA domain-containing protein [bacterium]|nr:VWA domain-containing protein [bacterium]
MVRIRMILVLILVLGVSLPAFADGFIVIPQHGRIFPPPRPRPPRPFPRPFPLEVSYHRVKVDIDGQVAVTAIDQEFYNPTHWRLEGYYLFPLPKNAVIKKFSMYVDGKELQAELLDAKKARRIYEDIVRRQRDPALLEYSGQGVFKARIFPIEPHSKKRVKISYSQLLSKDNQTVEYLYPLNTEKFSAKPLKDVSIHVDLNTTENIKTVYCPTHEVEISRKGKHRAVIGYEENNVKPDRDFKIYYSTDNEKLGFSLLSYKKEKAKGYFFLTLSPGFTAKNDEIGEKDITFVLDTSGSMMGKKLKQAKKALLFCIENLNRGDRFEIIRFSTEAEALFQEFSPVTEKKLDEAREFIDELRPMGGTNIDEALTSALKMKKRKGRPYMIIFLTDGRPTIGETQEGNLLDNIKKVHGGGNNSGARIFTFGIGHQINTHLLDKITEMTRAYRSYILPDEDIEVKVSNFYSKVQSPVLTDIKLNFGGGIRISKAYPVHLPDLFKGSSISLLGRYKGDGDADIVLTGKVKGENKTFKFHAEDGFKSAGDSEKDDFIPSLWAARRVGYLLEQIRLHGKDKELVDEVTQLARTYGIITPYTSYLIVEDERDNVRRRRIRHDDQTLALTPVGQGGRLADKVKREYSEFKSKSGEAGVRVSEETQQLDYAQNYQRMMPGKKRLNYKDKEGRTRNLQQQVKNIQGRAIYNTGKFWVDSQVQLQKSASVNRIQFASEEYFKLLRREPLSAQFLALGQNVRFVLNSQVFEIYD